MSEEKYEYITSMVMKGLKIGFEVLFMVALAIKTISSI